MVDGRCDDNPDKRNQDRNAHWTTSSALPLPSGFVPVSVPDRGGPPTAFTTKLRRGTCVRSLIPVSRKAASPWRRAAGYRGVGPAR